MTSEFLTITRTQFGSIAARYKRKKLPTVPFELSDYREHLLAKLGPSQVIQCRYCKGWFGVGSLVGDHSIPLSRQGGLGLDNIEFICAPCNHRKGKLLPEEYAALLDVLEVWHPIARNDILNRLEIAVRLVTSDRWRRKKAQ